MSSQAIDDSEFICRAQAGDAESLSPLADQVRQRVYAYIRRVTLQDDLAADLTQDTLGSVLMAIGSLRKTDLFWLCVFRIASDKVAQHYLSIERRNTHDDTTYDSGGRGGGCPAADSGYAGGGDQSWYPAGRGL